MRIIDTHCHLISDALKDDIPNILARAQEAGLTKIINIAYNLESSQLVVEHLKMSSMLYAAVGIQPHDVATYSEETATAISNIALNSNRVVAIGEIGLDAYFESTRKTLSLQQTCFEHFLDIACSLDLPVVVHVRNTHDEVFQLINKYSKKGLTGVIHCFTGTYEEAKQFLDCGFYISFAGIVTFKNASSIADVAQQIPENRILIETDSPYLAPVPMRGKTNEPSYLAHTCQFLAKKRGKTHEDFSELTYSNAHTLFKRLNN